MLNTQIEYDVFTFLSQACAGPVEVTEEYIEEFEKACGAAIRKQFTEDRGNGFRIRASNIGKPLRQLCLERDHGRCETLDPTMKLKMCFGDLVESLVIFCLRQAGVTILDKSKKVKLTLGGEEINGEFDVSILVNLKGKLYDIKSASSWSYKNKFECYETVAKTDNFGYVGQGFVYAKAEGIPFGGWIVIDKTTGHIKVVEVPEYLHDSEMEKHIAECERKVAHLVSGKPAPECDGVEDEYFRGKPTGNRILSKKCEFCDYKQDHCHKRLRYLPDICSTAKSKTMKYYVHVDEKYGV